MVPLFFTLIFMDLLKSHVSIRRYSKVNISGTVLNDILESGIRASNTGNMQLYSVIITRDQSQKNRLAPLHFNQSMVVESDVLLTICFDFNRFIQWCEVNNTFTDFRSILWLLNGFIDSSILAQSICIAAENVGVGICYLGTTLYNAKEISEILNLPLGVIPVTSITLGYPEENPEKTDRLSLDGVIHQETYKDYSDVRINELYSIKEGLNSSKSFVLQNAKENLAQVYAEVRYKTSDSIYFSTKLMDFLSEQGFNFDL